MATRIRTLNFLPEIFKTPTNSQFFSATLDQLVDQPNLKKIEGYIGSKFGYGINATSKYVVEPTTPRVNYQLDPGVVFLKNNDTVQDFVSYPGIVDALTVAGGVTGDHSRMFSSQFYAWDSFVDLDKIINFNQYYWVPAGLPPVTVAVDSIFDSQAYIVTDNTLGYSISASGDDTSASNPTITLLRGGVYTFAVNQGSQFWIQGEPGVTGFSKAMPNVQTREILGVQNNGQTVGLVTFTVPNKDAQDIYNFPGNNLVDLVTSTPFDMINGARVVDLNNIDSVTSLEGRTLMFYNTGVQNEQGYISTFYDAGPFDTTTVLPGTSVTVTASNASTDELTCASTALLRVGQTVSFTGTVFGGITSYQQATNSPVNVADLVVSSRYFITSLGDTDFTLLGAASNDIGVIFEATGAGVGTGTATLHNPSLYYVTEVVSSTSFKVSETLAGPAFALTTATGSMTAAINQGLYEGGYFTAVNSSFYTITYVGDYDNPVIRLVPYLIIPTQEKITSVYGNQWINRTFYKAPDGEIYAIPYYSAVLDTLYYQDGSSGNKVGKIKLIESNISNTLNVEDDILGKAQYTAPNGVVFTNGLKVTFAGDIAPAGFLDEHFYVEGVGTAIELIPVNDLVAAEILDNGEYIPYDSVAYDSTNFDSSLYVPVTADYITIARNAIDRNAWARSNRWVHTDVINATALYNSDPSIISTYTTHDAKARRPVVEFYPNLKLFQSGIVGKSPIDFIDFVATDAFVQVEGKNKYFPDVSVATSYTASINSASEKITTVISTSISNTITCRSTAGFSPADRVKVVGTGFGGLVENTVYFINSIIDETTMVLTDDIGDILILSDATGSVSLYGITTDSSDTTSTRYPNVVMCDSTAGMRVDDKVIFTGSTLGGLVANTVYFIDSISTDSAITVSATKRGAAIPISTASGAMDITVIPMGTTITLPLNATTGTFKVGHYLVDSENTLPSNTRIISITKTESQMILDVEWSTDTYGIIPAVSGVSLRATEGNSDNYAVFDGARIVFAADTNPDVRSKIYTARVSRTDPARPAIITLSPASDGQVLADELLFVYRGFNFGNKDFYFDGSQWLSAQQKTRVNQPPLFDVMDHNGKSLGDQTIYTSSSFKGTTLFSYGVGAGTPDAILGFPIRYSSVDNVGDISFDITLNSDEFNYVSGQQSLTQAVNTGYVHRYSGLTTFTRSLGWQTAAGPSVQRQVFEFTYSAATTNSTFVCDVAATETSEWPTVQVYVNNIVLDKSAYVVSVGTTSTTVNVTMPDPLVDTVVQLVILSDQVSKVGYYKIPINLNNNPLNADVTQVNVGDIRLHYQSIYANAPGLVGAMLGSNNYRDSGSLVKYGDAIVQHSAPLALPGALLRKQNHSLFDALLFNAKEYVNFKTLLVNTVGKNVIAGYPTPAEILDSAIDVMSESKNEDSPFFWSDMLPAKAAYITNTYTFANSLDSSIYPLNRIYDYAAANYFGVVVYLTRTINSVVAIKQLIHGKEYQVDSMTPSLTIALPLVPGDRVEIREYTQTYGNYVPNTPTKLGLYPATIPEVRLDNAYTQPTYFIVGHDGSYTRLYGEYDPVTGRLDDYRDQALLEFELRVFNNLKVNATVPLNEHEIMPGYFRETAFNADEVMDIYSTGFLNWVGQNRIDYQTQHFNQADPFSFNYYQSQNKLDKSVIQVGGWRGLYEYLFDTSNPAVTPWEMIGFANKPAWFDARYGEAPYTKDNLVLWGDMEAGVNYNNGEPYVVDYAVRPGLSRILPVDSSGNLLSPFESVVGNYVNQTFNHAWKAGDVGPAEFSYKRSSSWPFDLMRIFALTKPASFYNLAVDLDNYKYNSEFDQYLVNDRSHLVLKDIEIYGTGVAKTSYLNWIVDYEKQTGISATTGINELFSLIDVRLVYRLAGFSDKNLLKFYVEKSSTNSNNNTLLIPDESYAVLLYDNQPSTKIVYSSVIVQLTASGFKVFGNSQSLAYFTTVKPVINGNYNTVHIDNLTVQIANVYDQETIRVPYGTEYSSVQELCQFLASYGKYLSSLGVKFDEVTSGVPITWEQMVAEFLYWAQTGWETGSVLNLNPSADTLTIDKDSHVVQPLTIRDRNFVLNQNMYPILTTDMAVVREGTKFSAQTLKTGDSISYGEFNLSNIEHAVVFDNVTVFGDRIYNLVTGLRQDRITLRGTKTAEWNGTVDAQGFILNQDNVKEWNSATKYTAGSIVTYKNKYWTATKIVQAASSFNEKNWKLTDYDLVQKGLLPNPSTRSYESTVYYDSNRANLENDADSLSFSLIGYRPRAYLAVADLTDITQVNVYKNLIKSKGTPIAADAFKGATLSQGGIDYSIHENWAIKTGEFGGVMNSNYVEFRLNEHVLTSNPNIISLNSGTYTAGAHQEVSINKLYNYGRPINDPNILSVLGNDSPYNVLPSAGYVHMDDVKIMSYYYGGLTNNTVPLSKLNVWDNVWLAEYSGTWQVSTPIVAGQVVRMTNNNNGLLTVEFARPHTLAQYQAIAVVNFDTVVDGYYSVVAVVDTKSIQIRTTLNDSIKELTGKGICFSFDSVRVSTPSEISTLSLLNTEFTSNTIWVDTDTTGQWAVYRKKLNYAPSRAMTGAESYSERVPFQYPDIPVQANTFGKAVAFSTDMGYLIGDPGANEVNRYTYNTLFKRYSLAQVITHDTTFGGVIEHAGDTFVFPQPEVTSGVRVYRLVNNTLVNKVLPFNESLYGYPGSTGFDAATISGDRNWIYAVTSGNICAFVKSPVTGHYSITVLTAAQIEAPVDSTGFGYSLSTNYTGDVLVVGAPETAGPGGSPVTNWGKTYVYSRTVQNFEVQFNSIPFVPQSFPLTWTPAVYTISITGTAGPDVSVASSGLITDHEYTIEVSGTTDWTLVGAADNLAGTVFVATGTTAGTGTALASPAIFSSAIDTGALSVQQPVVFSGSAFGGVSANTVYYVRSVSATQFTVAPRKLTTEVLSTGGTNTSITVASTAGFEVGQPVRFYGYAAGSGIVIEQLYYVDSVISSTEFTITETVAGAIFAVNDPSNPDDYPVFMTVVTLSGPMLDMTTVTSSMTADVQVTPLIITRNGTAMSESAYAIAGSTLQVYANLVAGDILNVSGNNFVLTQTLTTESTPRVGVHFGNSVSMTSTGNEILVGAPFALTDNKEGAVYRYTNVGMRYGSLIGTSACYVSSPATILLNGYRVNLPVGDAASVAAAINSANITNISAYSPSSPVLPSGQLDPDYGILTISLIDVSQASPNNKLSLSVLDAATLTSLGMTVYAQTQIITDPHAQRTSQFGSKVKFNEFDSFVVSAPTSTRFVATTFDFSDNSNSNDDLLFDNNATRWVDTFPAAGAVYMYDYLANYDESTNNIGKFVYAQSINDSTLSYGLKPNFGYALEFNDNEVVVGIPDSNPTADFGRIIAYHNASGVKDWSVHRSASPTVDVDRLHDIQLYSADTNETLDTLDYIDPLSGKLLGSVQENIDVISNQDPAGYTSTETNTGAMVWASDKVGYIWFDTSTTKFLNYHQPDMTYNSINWGKIFPGSDVKVYTWTSSSKPPAEYTGPGTVYNVSSYTVEPIITADETLGSMYYFWVRNTSKVFTAAGKTLADTVIQSYIANPQLSGISYLTPLNQNVFGLVNCNENIHADDTILHIGFSTGTSDDASHSTFSLIRAEYADDFLPGLPNNSNDKPSSLYSKLLDSLCGVSDTPITLNDDTPEQLVPNPYLPTAVQTGILSRPNQSFFVNRYLALQNYIEYANEIIAQYPITETKHTPLLHVTGENVNTADYWEYISWWATGFNDTTKSVLQVPIYADLFAIKANDGLIVTVAANGSGASETYIYQNKTWRRIGLQNGTIKFKQTIWDYPSAGIGFGDSFFDTTPYAEFPSHETRNIIRSLTEEIFTDELIIHRNKSLILLFEYIQSETTDLHNYLPWLNKTSFIDVSHTIRELLPVSVYRDDNQSFLEGYLNEVKPYHVVIKDFIFKYNGTSPWQGDVTDFDLPAKYDNSIEQFVTPELVYSNPSLATQKLADDSIWEDGAYTEWYKNHGLSLTGIDNYPITLLTSYMVLNTTECTVDNAFGFPVTGFIQIDDEIIAYSSVDRNRSILYGLSRGAKGTAITTHIPGAQIIIDLPPVLLLNSGRGYTSLPTVVASFDLDRYPVTTTLDVANPATGFRPAILSAVMQFDTIMRIDVIDPGAGYPVTPDILIQPAAIVSFSSAEVQLVSNTVRIYNTSQLFTGDLIRYVNDEAPIAGVSSNEYYYIGVLDITPTLIIALYTSYADAVNDKDRVTFLSTGSGTNYLEVGGKASCVTTALPIRENIITLRFDRTTYSSDVVEWSSGSFYSAYYAGKYNNSARVASSAITLESTRPPITSIFASAQGAAFALLDVTPTDVLTWSSSTRGVVSILSDGTITLKPSDLGAPDAGTVGPTLGFYVDMPVKFTGLVSGGILNDQEYYVSAILSDTDITISETVGGAAILLSAVPAADSSMKCVTGSRTLGTVVTVDYDGISEVTATDSDFNTITVPLSGTGQNGTTGFYIGLPVIFNGVVVKAGTMTIGHSYVVLSTGTSDFTQFGASINEPGVEFVATNIGSGTGTVTSLFGGLIENDQYYVTTVVDSQTFTVSRKNNPVTFDVTSIQPRVSALALNTTTGTNLIHCNVTLGIQINDPVIFTGTVFGNIVADTIYYALSVDTNNNDITVSETLGGVEFALTTDTGVMSLNAKPVLVCTSTLDIQINDPIIFNDILIAGVSVTSFGGIQTGTRYYVSEKYIGNTTFSISTTIDGSSIPLTLIAPSAQPALTACRLTSQVDVEQLTTGIGSMIATTGLPISPGQVNGQRFTMYASSDEYANVTGTDGNLIVRTVANASGVTTIIGTTAGTDEVILLAGIPELQLNDEITVTGTAIGNLVPGTYYVKSFTSYTTFKVSTTRTLGVAGAVFTQSTATGTMSLLDVDNTIVPLNRLSITSASGGLLDVYDNMPFTLAGAYGGLVSAHTYYVLTTDRIEVTVTTTSSSGNLLTCNSTAGFYPGMFIFFTGPILGGLEYELEYYVDEVISATQFTLRGSKTPGPVIIVTTTNGAMTGTGEVYITVCDTAPGSAVIELTSEFSDVVLTQAPTALPAFNASYILGGYRVIISSLGEGYAVNNTITIPGTLVGGTAPANNLVLTVSSVDATGKLLTVACAGQPNEAVNSYYFKVISDTQAELYHDGLMTVPVNGYEIAATFAGITSTAVTGTSESGDIITITDIGLFSVNDEVVFTGFLGNYGNIIPGIVYYIKTIASTDVTISETLGGATFTLSNKTGNCVMSRAGAYLLLPEPFYFNQTIVSFNHRMYQCVVSNSDHEFIFSKWQELRSDSRRLNALDRIAGYYAPTVNMPGRDPTQLVDGISYPNSVYSGNPFAPEESHEIDTVLQNIPFSSDIFDLTSVVWSGTEYVITANSAEYSATLHSAAASEWSISKVTSSLLNVADIVEVSGQFVMTSMNTATPVLTSTDGVTWTTSGLVAPSVSVPDAALVSVAHLNGTYVAVGDRIVTSMGSGDVTNWTETFTFYTSNLVRTLTGVAAIENAGFTGFVVVGKGQKYAYPVGSPVTTTDVNILMISNDGMTWTSPTGTNELTTFGLNAVAHNSSRIVVVGDNSVRYYSPNGSTWISASASEPAAVSDTVSTNNSVVVSSTASLAVNSPVTFIGFAFGNIVTDATYYVKSIPTVTAIAVTATTSGTNRITCANTSTLAVGQPIVFTGTTFGNITEGAKYYVTAIPSSTEFTMSISTVGSDLVLTTDTGTCTVENLPTITISASLVSGVAGPEFTLATDQFVQSNIPCYVITVNSNINDLINDGVNFVAVGDNGLIESSVDGIVWTSQVSGSSEHLHGITHNAGEYIVVGANNTILKSVDLVNWLSVSTLISDTATYNVQGDDFLAGYGPEELVPGVVSDNLTMIINTRPGSNWDVQSYAHAGYNVVSVEITPT